MTGCLYFVFQQIECESPSITEEVIKCPDNSRNTTPTHQQNQLQQSEIFKKPGDKPTTKKSPVSVDTSNLQLPCPSDVEMLSAQSTDGSKAIVMQTPRTPLVEKQVHVPHIKNH